MKELGINSEMDDATASNYHMPNKMNNNKSRVSYLAATNQSGKRRIAQNHKLNNVKNDIHPNLYANPSGHNRDTANNGQSTGKAEGRSQYYPSNPNSTKVSKASRTDADVNNPITSQKVLIAKKNSAKSNTDIARTAIKSKNDSTPSHVIPSENNEGEGKGDSDNDNGNKYAKLAAKNKKKKQRKLQSRKLNDDIDLNKNDVIVYDVPANESFNLRLLPDKFNEPVAVDFDKDIDPDMIVNNLEVEIENAKKEVQDCEAKLNAVIKKNCSISRTDYEKLISRSIRNSNKPTQQ